MTTQWHQIARELADAVKELKAWHCEPVGKEPVELGPARFLQDGSATVKITDAVALHVPAQVASQPRSFAVEADGVIVRAEIMDRYGLGARAAALARRAIQILNAERANLVDRLTQALGNLTETEEAA